MGHPSTSLATLRPDLAASLEQIDLLADRQGFIGLRVLPVFETDLASSPFGKITLESLLQSPETKRAPGAGYGRGDWAFTTDTYATVEHGWEEPIDDNEAKMYANYFDLETVSAARALDIVLRSHEKRVADAVFNATTFASYTAAVTNEWDANHKTDAVPLSNVNTARNAIWSATGLWANALIINKKVMNNLRALDQITDAIASSGAGSSIRARDITADQLARCFDLDYVLVAGSAKNTANEAQTRSLSPIWSDEYAMVARLCTGPDLREPGLGRTFHWGADGSQIGGTVETYRDETVRSDIVRVRNQTDEKLLYVAAAYLLSNITTT
jgi:hypothetical protein